MPFFCKFFFNTLYTYCGINFIVCKSISAAPRYSLAMCGSSQAALYKQVSPIRYPRASASSPSDTIFSEISRKVVTLIPIYIIFNCNICIRVYSLNFYSVELLKRDETIIFWYSQFLLVQLSESMFERTLTNAEITIL